MNVNLTLKGVPGELNRALDEAAARERRSKNAQTIVWLEQRARQEPRRLPPEELRRRVRELAKSCTVKISAAEHRRWVKEGRP